MKKIRANMLKNAKISLIVCNNVLFGYYMLKQSKMVLKMP